MLTDFRNSFSVRLTGKFAANSCLNIPPHLKYVATLPCKISRTETQTYRPRYVRRAEKGRIYALSAGDATQEIRPMSDQTYIRRCTWAASVTG